jgi:regulator of replication initiation timing
MDSRQADPAPVTPSGGTEADALLADRQALERERAALRIQAAAVAAQQAALTEQERRLLHQQHSFDQQQEQLAAHLEGRRQKLLELQQRIQLARDELRAEQATHRQLTQESRAQWELAQTDVAQALKQEAAERQRLMDLRKRLKKRWHRQWAGEKARLQNQEQALAARHAALNRQVEDLKRKRAALTEERLRLNGETELGRRHVRDAWNELRQATRDWHAKVLQDRKELDQSGDHLNRLRSDLAHVEKELVAKQRRAEQNCEQLAQEADGLERRVGHLRRKLLDQEQEGRRLEAVLAELRTRTGTASPGLLVPIAAPVAGLPGSRTAQVVPFAVPAVPDQGRRGVLADFAEKLSDSRLHLFEQCLRLLHAWQLWHQDHEAATVELAIAGARLTEREENLTQRERALEPLESDLRRLHAEIVQVQHRCEGWQARLHVSEAALRAERETLLARVRSRETHADQQTALVAELRRHWTERRRLELETLRAERGRCLEMQRRAAELCEDYFHRNQDVEREARALAVKALSLDEYRLHFIATAENAALTERRLVRLRRRWDKRFAAAERKLARDGAALSSAVIRIEKQATALRRLNDDLTGREETFARNLSAWEEDQLQAEITNAKMDADLRSHRLHREVLERQVSEERAEIERLAHVLLHESLPPAPAIMRAA